jgi:hypothetical protein
LTLYQSGIIEEGVKLVVMRPSPRSGLEPAPNSPREFFLIQKLLISDTVSMCRYPASRVRHNLSKNSWVDNQGNPEIEEKNGGIRSGRRKNSPDQLAEKKMRKLSAK